MGKHVRSVVSDLGLHCLSMSLLWDARFKWVNPYHFLARFSRQQIDDVLFPENRG